MSLGTWIDKNDKRVRFLAWVAVGAWAVLATIVANVPPDTHIITTVRNFPPQTVASMELSCTGHELAESWSVTSSNPSESALYTSNQMPILKDGIRVGYRLNVLNGAGSSNPTRPPVDVTLALSCQYEHSQVVQALLWPLHRLQGIKAD